MTSGATARRRYIQHARPVQFAHRGGALLAPENTLAAFANGIACGADALETDIQITRDGELVTFHDDTLERTTDGTGKIASFTLAELRQRDAGYRFTPDGGLTYPFRGQGITIPTLREVFAQFPTQRINIDLKADDPARERRLWEIIQAARAEERTLVASEEYAPIARFRRLTGGRVATAASRREIIAFYLAALSHTARWRHPAYDALQIPETYAGLRLVIPRTVAAARQMGVDLHVWTINDQADMRRLLALGVDGIMTDRPDVLAALQAES